MVARNAARRSTEVVIWADGRSEAVPDQVAVEAPLEIRLVSDSGERVVAITMRTPGHDGDLATGYLFAEGLLREPADLIACERPTGADGAPLPNRVRLRLRPGLEPEMAHLDRHSFTTSACGLCGKTSLESVTTVGMPRPSSGPAVDADVVLALPRRMRSAQGTFQATGGLHAAALFDAGGALLDLAEDVGRHNALDKLIGRAFAGGRVPLADHLVLVSGRASYELVQKCLAAGVPMLAAVSAPSSLAVATAREHGMTLVGFLRDGRFNLYAGGGRLGL